MKDKWLWILLGGIVLISLAFLLLDFRVAVSNTQAAELVFTTDMGNDMPVPMQQNDKISVVMVGEGLLVNTLQKAIKEKMSKDGMWQIELVQGLEPVYQNPALVVKVSRLSPIWSPFSAMSQFSVHAGYASNGGSTFLEAVEATHTSIGKKMSPICTLNTMSIIAPSGRSLAWVITSIWQIILLRRSSKH